MRSVICVLFLLFPVASRAADVQDRARELAWSSVQAWIATPVVLTAVEAQNAAHRALSESEILALDQQWREELKLDPTQRGLIHRVLAVPLSSFLRDRADGSNGAVRELFVMDARGLLVGTNRTTSDYWQGDEDKWLRVVRERASVHVGELGKDESTQTYLVHVSFPIVAPGSTQPIGAITVGVNVEKLATGSGADG